MLLSAQRGVDRTAQGLPQRQNVEGDVRQWNQSMEFQLITVCASSHEEWGRVPAERGEQQMVEAKEGQNSDHNNLLTRVGCESRTVSC